MSLLADLGQKFGTDKGDSNHSFRGTSYLHVYERYFGPTRGEVKKVLEIGVYQGASLRMWQEFFPNAMVHGFDIDPSRVFQDERIRVHTGSQNNVADLMTIGWEENSQDLDIVIDDGSHVVEHQLCSFDFLWPRLRPGGFYCIEDLYLSYNDLTSLREVWPGQHLNPKDTPFRNNRSRMDEFFKERIWVMDSLRGDCLFVHFWPQQVIMQKI